MKIQISPHHFLELSKKAYSLDMLYMLQLIEADYDVQDLCTQSARVKNVYQGLSRKGLITEKGDVSLYGKEIIAFSEKTEEIKLAKKVKVDDVFNEWWKAYPGTDTFVYGGRRFSGSRSLRVGKAKCLEKFNAILGEGEFSPKQLIESLKFDVLQKKEASIKQRANKITYMQNSLTYLNQRSYEPFIELINEGVRVKPASKKSKEIDI